MSEWGGGTMTPDELERLEYHGVAGGSHDCQDAVMRLLQFGDRIVRVCILTPANHHGLLLTKEVGDRVAIPSGFASGYGGAGPNYFSVALQLLDTHGAEIDERELEEAQLERLNRSGLTMTDDERDRRRTARPAKPVAITSGSGISKRRGRERCGMSFRQ
jgi:hypothetical protein